MKTKIVYVLISSPADIFLEQAYVSMYSLKKHNPSATVVVVSDDETYFNITNDDKRSCFAKYIDEWKYVSFGDDISNKERSRWLKTNLRNILHGNLLFVDTDTIICGDISEIDNMDYELAITLDLHTPLENHPYRDGLRKRIRRMYGVSIPNNIQYFNSGVMLMKDTKKCQEFFEKWHNNWKAVYRTSFGCFDQQPLIKTVIDFGGYVSELSGDYNCQLLGSIQYLHTAKIVHFFNTQWSKTVLHPLFDKNFYLAIKHNGDFDDNQKNIIENCKSTIVSPSMPIGIEDMKIWNSSEFRCLQHIKDRHILRWMALIALKALYFANKLLTHRGGG